MQEAEQVQKDDHGNRNAEQPKQDIAGHRCFSGFAWFC
jgi:hypothetical protein